MNRDLCRHLNVRGGCRLCESAWDAVDELDAIPLPADMSTPPRFIENGRCGFVETGGPCVCPRCRED